MIARYGLRPRAQRDIDEIWDYTARQWSLDQADAYIRQLQHAIEVLAASPDTGPSCDAIRPGYRKYAAGSHVIFYQPTHEGIDVVRILHQRMDAPKHV